MPENEKKHFKIAALLYLILIILIYFGSYLKYLLSYSWLGKGSVIVIIFIWLTVFFIATIITARGLFLVKQRLRGKERLDFVAQVGALAAEFGKAKSKMNVGEFFEAICRENGITEIPNLNKYSKDNFTGQFARENVFRALRLEVETAAIAHSRKKK